MTKENTPLFPYTTFRIGGRARYFYVIKDFEVLVEAATFARKQKLPLIILGGGSNILFSDKDLKILVIKNEIKNIVFTEFKDRFEVRVGSGVSWDYLVSRCISMVGFSLENLSGIPGTVGGAIFGNIGAYGEEIKDYVKEVEVVNLQNFRTTKFSRKKCDFAYRDSFFKKKKNHKYFIKEVIFTLPKNKKANISYGEMKELAGVVDLSASKVRKKVLEIRKNKLPDLRAYGSAGSFFKNPILSKSEVLRISKFIPSMPIYKAENGRMKLSAAYLLDKIANSKNTKVGEAGFYERHSLCIVNNGNASFDDVFKLKEKVKRIIKNKLKINLEEEVIVVDKKFFKK